MNVVIECKDCGETFHGSNFDLVRAEFHDHRAGHGAAVELEGVA